VRLRRSDCSGPGITRVRCGRGWTYRNQSGRVTDADTLARISALAIPPAWTEVWICPDDRGHLQAVGLDSEGRLQYLYHPHWRLRRDALKHERALDLGLALTSARPIVTGALSSRRLDRGRVLGCAFRLLDLGAFRIGSEAYAATSGALGLATVRREHVSVHGDTAIFDYPAKSSRRQEQRITDAAVARTLRLLLARDDDNPELLAWRERHGWRDVHSTDVNEFVREATGGDFTAKDFRTFNASVLALELLAPTPRPSAERLRRRVVADVMREVAAFLGNTPAVARASYVDPRVISSWERGRLSALPEDAPRQEFEALLLQTLRPAMATVAA